MEPGPELDARVAIEIMEFTSADAYKPSQDGPLRFIEGVWRSWSPSTSISDAMEVVGKMRAWGRLPDRPDCPVDLDFILTLTDISAYCEIRENSFMGYAGTSYKFEAVTAETWLTPETTSKAVAYAICLAALKAVGKEA